MGMVIELDRQIGKDNQNPTQEEIQKQILLTKSVADSNIAFFKDPGISKRVRLDMI